MKDKINEAQLSDEIIRTLDFGKTYSPNIKDFIRPNEHPDISQSLKLYFDNKYSDSINDYLESVEPKEMNFFRFFENQIPLTDSMNPHVPYKLEEYFVDRTDTGVLKHLIRLSDLLQPDEKGKLPLKECNGILHIGEKGSGKTFSQNIWLHKNNMLLENNKIFWVRLDAAKLIRIWDDSKDINNPNLTTIEEYFLGQIVYVFCKHFIEQFPMRNELFVEIANKLKVSGLNNISKPIIDTKSKADDSITPEDIFEFYANKWGFSTIIEVLKDFERQIAIHEGLFKGMDKRTPKVEREYSDRSFLVDKVLLDSQRFPSDRYKGSKSNWMVIGRLLKKFILDNGYWFLYIIDGMENINYKHHHHRDYIEKMFSGLYEFPLNQHNSHKHEKVIISLRDTTYEALSKMSVAKHYTDTNRYINIESFTKIWQDSSNIQKIVFDTRINYVSKRIQCKDCFMSTVIKKMLVYHNIPNEERWNSNFRCFMKNHLTLAKLITFRYYFNNQPRNFNIEDQIDTFENINYYLNGELYINEQDRDPATNKGHNLFNLFGFVEDETNYPSYLIYTRLLQLISRKPRITENKLHTAIKVFDYKKSDVNECLDKLVWSGLIKSIFYPKSKDKVRLHITEKGKFALKTFFNDIHYLYYSCLNTLLPEKIIHAIKVSPNNFPVDSIKKKFYPPNSIITGMLFLQFLIEWNNYELQIVKNKELGSDIEAYNLPIDNRLLKESINGMVEAAMKDDDYLKILKEKFPIKD